MKDQILKELSIKWIPDLSLFEKDDAIALIPELLSELLDEDKKWFQSVLAKKNEELKFDDIICNWKLWYLWNVLETIVSTDNNIQLRNIVKDFMWIYQDFLDDMAYSVEYYDKLVWMKNNLKLDDEQNRILELDIKAYKQRGIDLSIDTQKKIKELNKQIIEVGENFKSNLVDEQSEFSYYLPDDSSIQDLPKDLLTKAKAAAWENWWYLFDATPNWLIDLIRYSTDSKVRKYICDTRESWASKWKYDNRENVLLLLKLNQEKAQLMWYKNAWEMFLVDTMAQTPQVAKEFILKISKKAKEKAKFESERLKKYFWLDILDYYDLSYYSRKYKEENYQINDEEIKQYFEFDYVLSWMFDFVKKFFWVSMKLIETENQNQMWYEVYYEWEQIAYFMLDAFYRKGKRSGAWTEILRRKSDTELPIVINVSNFSKVENGPTLLKISDLETLFHEFGHAIHAMLWKSKYSELSWFNVERDFVELPSQLLENWVDDSVSLAKLSKHYQTWESLSQEILDKLDKLSTYWMWNRVLRQNELALVDLNLYMTKVPESVEELDEKILGIVNQNTIFKRWEEYKMYCSFLHVFGWWYESKYYSYMRADQLQADVFSKIKSGWMFDPKVWNEYVEKILKQWACKPARELFYDYMWRAVSEQALIEKYGLDSEE